MAFNYCTHGFRTSRCGFCKKCCFFGSIALDALRVLLGCFLLMLDKKTAKSKILKVEVAADRTVRLEWGDGATELIDLAPLLANHRSYVALRTNDELFATATISADQFSIQWANTSQISSTALQKLPRTQMDAHEFRAIMVDLRLSVEGLSSLLGLSKRVIADYRAGSPIPKPLALALRYLEERGGI